MEKSKKQWVRKFLGIREGLTTIIMGCMCGNNTSSIECILRALADSPGLTCPLILSPWTGSWGERLHPGPHGSPCASSSSPTSDPIKCHAITRSASSTEVCCQNRQGGPTQICRGWIPLWFILINVKEEVGRSQQQDFLSVPPSDGLFWSTVFHTACPETSCTCQATGCVTSWRIVTQQPM